MSQAKPNQADSDRNLPMAEANAPATTQAKNPALSFRPGEDLRTADQNLKLDLNPVSVDASSGARAKPFLDNLRH